MGLTKKAIPAGDYFYSEDVDDKSLHLADQSIDALLTKGVKSPLYQERLNATCAFTYHQQQFLRTKQQCNITCLESLKVDNMECANTDCNMFYTRLSTRGCALSERQKLNRLGVLTAIDLPEDEYIC